MRRYRIEISSFSTSSGPSKLLRAWDSQINGQDNTAALDIAFDISTAQLSSSFPGSYIEIFGLSLQDVASIRQYQGQRLSIFGGFSAGYPLANPKQYGLLATGTVQQAYGNWTGIEQSGIFILTPPNDEVIVMYWAPGQKLSAAITQALANPYPGITVKSQLKNDPVASATGDMTRVSGIFAFSNHIRSITNAMGLAPAQGGISLALDNTGSTLNIYDAPFVSKPVQLSFNDLQGQPIYFGPSDNTPAVQTAVNLRYDLSLGGQFTFPTPVAAGYVLNQPASGTAPLAKNNSALTGTFNIVTLRHVGRFRDPQGESWVTVAEGNPSS